MRARGTSRGTSRWTVAAVGALLAILAPGLARAQDDDSPLARARAALADLDSRKASSLLGRALRSGEQRPAQMVELYRLLGEVHATLGQRSKAEAHFQRLLTLRRDARLPGGSSPKLVEPFEAARRAMANRKPLEVSCATDSATSSVTLDVTSDPLGMVAGARVLFWAEGGEPRPIGVQGTGPFTLAIPALGPVRLYCAALDEYGNHLVEVGSPARPLQLGEPAADTTVVARSGPAITPWYARGLTWGVTTVVLAGLGTYFAVETRSTQAELEEVAMNSSQHDFTVAEGLEQRGRRYALATNLTFTAAGVCAAAAVILYLRERARSDDSSPQVTVAPIRHGATVSLSLRF